MKQAAIQHGIKIGEIYDDIKVEDLTESTWGYIIENLFKEEGVCVFYLNAEDNQQSAERVYFLLGKFFQMDGNDFIPYTDFDKTVDRMISIPHDTIEGGDNKLVAIAAASILAKDSRDTYMEELCKEYPELITRYGLEKNMGYGTKLHIDGIKQYGITEYHRRTYGLCKINPLNPINK
jgi:ribonuclease HII